ncbi:MAG: M48 family metallopeptidase [Oleispira sp.]
MQTSIKGTYQLAGRSESHPASAIIFETGQVIIQHLNGESIMDVWPDNYQFSDVIPGLAVDLVLADGALFVPHDKSYRWPQLTSSNLLAEWLESHWLVVLSSVLVVPLFLWSMVNYVLPGAAHAAVAFLPDSIAESMGEQTLYILDKTQFDPSELDTKQQQHVSQLWQRITTQLELPDDKYQLHFRKFDLGANAMALPDGSIIVTDDIVTLMKDDPDALLSVLLHEVGHVEHQHSLKMIAQTTATTMLFAMMFGDIDGAGELILGAGTGLLQTAFSRDMEREADEFSHQNLPAFNISPAAFADAMTLLANSHSLSDDEESANENSDEDVSDNEDQQAIKRKIMHWLQYLSSHPETQERIDTARKKGEENSELL